MGEGTAEPRPAPHLELTFARAGGGVLHAGSWAEIERARRFVLRHGHATSAFQTLKPGFSFSFDESTDSCIAYADTGSAWVAAGPPLAEPRSTLPALQHFVARARACGKRVCFVGLSREQAARLGFRTVRLGDEPFWLLDDWARTVKSHRGLHGQLRRATRHGVRVRTTTPDELAPGSATRRALEGLVRAWLARLPLPPLCFLVDVRPFEFLADRLVTVAEHEGEIVAFASLAPVPARGGFLLENLVRRECPNGTSELLVARAFEDARAAGASFVSLGLAPLRAPEDPFLGLCRRWGRSFYRFEGLLAFKERLHPSYWEEYLLAHPDGTSRFGALYDMLSAFVGDWGDFGRAFWLRRLQGAPG